MYSPRYKLLLCRNRIDWLDTRRVGTGKNVTCSTGTTGHPLTEFLPCVVLRFSLVGTLGNGQVVCNIVQSWWRHQMETFSALLAICAGKSSVTGKFLAQRPGTRSFDVSFDLRRHRAHQGVTVMIMGRHTWPWGQSLGNCVWEPTA